ncbi:MAG TPA: SPFH domain-containing protein [Candidatus Sulfotelmatobacter sp.]|nr:SPFH domain-containing protein [Candidatus Sulfotelmatobacter sp.]
MNTSPAPSNHENVVRVQNGWALLALLVIFLLGDFGLLLFGAKGGRDASNSPSRILVVGSVLLFVVLVILFKGFFTLQPNEARVLVLFGDYKGTVRTSGFHWANPFYSNGASQPGSLPAGDLQAKLAAAKSAGSGFARNLSGRNKISLRARSLNGEKLKVNDKRGNPIEIAAVVVWRVQDTAQATFDVDNYESYVATQSESALRHLASLYSYDYGEDHENTLRGNVTEVSQALRSELQERFGRAGVVVDEARLTHLAYAPEIAQAMLRRQQAEAVIAARQKIVQGAVSMVEMALKELADKHVVNLDDERRAAMVSNLMVVLCGESEVHPVVNAGTLYN